ncbi:MAG: GNAT family N-acetyltransferase, partial [Chloroflexota bacterium]
YWAQALAGGDGRRPIYVAEDEKVQIVGFAAGGPEREQDAGFQGEVYAIYVLAIHQRLGIGGDLFRAVAARLAEAGMTSLLVWVLVANPARRFYEALGGTLARERRIEIGGALLDEVAYGWPDTRGLAEGEALAIG